jgi:hypothetical protein
MRDGFPLLSDELMKVHEIIRIPDMATNNIKIY